MSKPTRKQLVDALWGVCTNADEDCPLAYRTHDFRQTLYDAWCLLEDEDGKKRHTYARPGFLEDEEED